MSRVKKANDANTVKSARNAESAGNAKKVKRAIYFDCVNGISGDMVLGAMVHLGVSTDTLKGELDKLLAGKYDLVANKKQVSGISGIDLEVILNEEPKKHTSHSEIVEMIDRSELPAEVKKIAKDIFKVIARAEAAVHDKKSDDVHFHEVGALDSIIDVVGAAIAIDRLGVEVVYCSPIHDGSGTINCRHGEIPVPVPAVMEMLKESDIRIKGVEADTELVTPTGFGILEGLSAECVPIPEMKVMEVGYGFGKRDTGRFNGLRIIIGEVTDGE